MRIIIIMIAIMIMCGKQKLLLFQIPFSRFLMRLPFSRFLLRLVPCFIYTCCVFALVCLVLYFFLKMSLWNITGRSSRQDAQHEDTDKQHHNQYSQCVARLFHVEMSQGLLRDYFTQERVTVTEGHYVTISGKNRDDGG